MPPNLSLNSSSGVTKVRQEQSDTQLSSTTSNYETLTETETHDWYYGTQELLDALPPPWTRSLLYLLVGFAAIILPWCMLSRVDEIGTARGRMEPIGTVQRLDAATSGTVVAVKVKEGESVKAGQVLVELESNILQTNLQASQAKLQGDKNQLAQLNLLKNQLLATVNIQNQQNQAQQFEKLAQLQQARQNLDALKSAYNLKKQEQQAKVNQAQQELISSIAAYKLAEVRFQGAQEKVPRYKKVWQKGAISQDRFLEVQQSVQENYQILLQAGSKVDQDQSNLQGQQSSYKQSLRQARSDIQQAQLRLAEQQGSYQSLIHAGQLALLKSQEQIKNIQSQITSLQSEIAQIISQILSLNWQLQQRVLRSPVDGVVFALPTKKPGVVVQPGQMMAQVAPKRSALILRAQIASQQSGFVRVGMPVKIKFDAYPFQDYGVVQGHITWISPDSKVTDNSAGKVETFELEIALDHPYIQAGNKRIELTPGQTATAEVIVRQRRIIDFLLDPFRKLQKSGLEL